MAESGMRVLVLDAGRSSGPASAQSPRSYQELRRDDPRQWRRFLGADLEALRGGAGPPSPKFDAPGGRWAWEGFAESQGIEGRDFTIVGSLARGGLSNLWGAGFSTYSRSELAEFPFEPEELAPHYARVARRAGVSGFERDDLWTEGVDDAIETGPPLELAENARRLLDRYQRDPEPIRRLGVRLGRTRQAVLTRPQDGRGACTRCDRCLWGCDEGAIFSAAHDLERLIAHERVSYRPGRLVRAIERAGEGWSLGTRALDGAAGERWSARRVVLAASTLATTRLLLAMQGRHGEAVPLLGSPTIGLAVVLPERLGAALPVREFSMGQISFVFGAGAPDAVFGSFFSASGIPAFRLVEFMPLSRRGALRFHRWLQPTLLLANGFFPGQFSRYQVELEHRSGEDRLVVSGRFSEALPARLAAFRSALARALLRLGALQVPGSLHLVPPGADFRYAGTLPMRRRPGRGEVDPLGEVFGAPGLHVVDLSIFPALPARNHSFTMMAIADLIGRGIATRWSAERR
jgi:choline dehydrogenase-like flavoprotein